MSNQKQIIQLDFAKSLEFLCCPIYSINLLSVHYTLCHKLYLLNFQPSNNYCPVIGWNKKAEPCKLSILCLFASNFCSQHMLQLFTRDINTNKQNYFPLFELNSGPMRLKVLTKLNSKLNLNFAQLRYPDCKKIPEKCIELN